MIIVGIDGSPESVAALNWAVEDAKRRNTKVEAIMGFEVPWTIIFAGSYTESDYHRDAKAAFQKIVDGIDSDFKEVQVDMKLVQRKPGLALVEASKHAELLVVGSHGYGFMPGLQLGSVASYCVNRAHCPVLVHRKSS